MMGVIMFLFILFMLFTWGNAAAEPELIGGRHAEPGQFPEIVYISNQNSRCTATIIGPNVLLTAGHCIDESGVVSFSLNNKTIRAACAQHPLYKAPQKEDMDIALCKTNAPMNVKYASISTRSPAVGDVITLSGYGCIKPGGGGGNDGILRYGEAKVTALERPLIGYNWFDTRGSTAICFGDSGGPAFRLLTNPRDEVHVVLGVNSRGDIKNLSMLAPTYFAKAQDWMVEWSTKMSSKICGINKDCINDGDQCGFEQDLIRYWEKESHKCERILYDLIDIQLDGVSYGADD